MKVNFKLGSTSKLKAKLNKARDHESRALAHQIYDEVVKRTPVRSGNAKRNWKIVKKLSSSKGDWLIYNNVPYIDRLDNGYSRQAPQGIVKPALKAVKARRK